MTWESTDKEVVSRTISSSPPHVADRLSCTFVNL